ncbi:MAG: FGGY-family carbohydrate kinase [Planctomycetota bacterium]
MANPTRHDNCVLGIDIGTTAIKAVVLDADGDLGPVVSGRYSLNAGSGGRFEQDPEELLTCLCKVVREAARSRNVQGIGLSTQAAALMLLDKNAAPICPIISWMDHRASAEKEALLERHGADFFRSRTGLETPGIAAPLLLWLQQNKPGLLKQAASISFVEDWILRWLTGSGGTDPTNTSITGLLNLDTLTWDADVLDAVGVGVERFPPMRRAGEVAGRLLPEATDRLGLAQGIPVAVPAHDQHCAALGAGLVESGTAMLSTGTAWVVFALANSIDRTQSKGLFLAPYAAGDLWGALGAMPAGNAYFDRIMDALGVENYETAEREARDVGPGAGGLLFLPSLAGERRAAWIGFTLEHVCGHMLRSVMEGLAMEAAFFLQEIEAATGKISEIAMLGGSAKNRLWVEIASSIFDRPISAPSTGDAAVVGAAVFGGMAGGWWASAAEGRRRVNLPVERVRSDPGPYRDVLARYSEARGKFPSWH